MKIDVKRIRKKTGLTNAKIAKIIGCHKQWLTNSEKECKPNKTDIWIIGLSDLSGIPIDELCVNTDEYEEEQKRIVVLSWIKTNIDNCLDPVQKENAEKLLKLYHNVIK